MTTARPINEDDLQAFVDGALDARRHAEVEAWLVRHPDIAERVATDIARRGALRATLWPIVEEPLPASLNLSRLVEQHRRPPARAWVGGWQAATAALLLIVGGAGGWSLRGAQTPQAGIGALAREANDSYAVYASDTGHPVEMAAADAPRFVQWASDRLQRPVAIPDLSAAGYDFIGGRVVPTPHGPAVLYMFDNGRGTRLALLSRIMKVDRNAPMRLEEGGTVSSVSWADDGLGFSLVGPMDEAALHPIAERVRAQVDPVA